MSEITAKYRLVFDNPMGREVLADILTICHFGSALNPDNAAQIGMNHVGVAILARLGVFGPGTKQDVINALLTVTPNDNK